MGRKDLEERIDKTFQISEKPIYGKDTAYVLMSRACTLSIEFMRKRASIFIIRTVQEQEEKYLENNN